MSLERPIGGSWCDGESGTWNPLSLTISPPAGNFSIEFVTAALRLVSHIHNMIVGDSWVEKERWERYLTLTPLVPPGPNHICWIIYLNLYESIWIIYLFKVVLSEHLKTLVIWSQPMFFRQMMLKLLISFKLNKVLWISCTILNNLKSKTVHNNLIFPMASW